MKYIKLFESVGFGSIIRGFWKIDPLEFQRILTDALEVIDIWGDIEIRFVIYYPYPNSDSESKTIFHLNSNGDFKKGTWFDNFDSLKVYSTQDFYDLGKSSIPGIELNISSPEEDRLRSHRSEDVQKFKKFIYNHFRERNIQYGFMNDITFWTDSYGVDFIYTGAL